MHLGLIERHTGAITELTARIEAVIEPFQGFRDLICSIPGISTIVADVIIAETGADMTRFPTAGHLASWAGACPGHHESAGRVKSTRAGDRRDRAHHLVAIWNMAHTGALYDDLGADYYTYLRPERAKNRAIHQRETMGYNVTLARAG